MAFKTSIIGLGIMGKRMLEHMTLHPEFVVDTIWDPDTAACQAARKLAPNSVVASSPEDAMRDADIVYLACSPVPRKAYALAAAGQGKAVFLEKPLGTNVVESCKLVSKLNARGGSDGGKLHSGGWTCINRYFCGSKMR